MPADGVGSSVIIALAALLWLAYLVPSWLRRREYLSTERNALRLQQTLRVMAESAEVPAEVRVETNARNVVRQEKLLRKQEERLAAVARAEDRARDAALARAAARRLAEVQPVIAADVAVTSSASRRLRRSRAITSLILLIALGAAGVGVAQLLISGAWLLLASGIVVSLGSFVMLGQMATVSKARAELAHGLRAQPVVRPVAEPVATPVVREQVSWTPVPLPKPLYLSRPQVARAVDASLQAAAELRQAAADAERKLREAHEAPEVVPIRPTAVKSASRFASMGIVDAAETATPDLDAALARRRA